MRRGTTILSLLLFLMVLGTNQVFGQFFRPPRKRKDNIQSVYFELFGNGIFYSLDYDVVNKNHFGTRAGVGFDFFTYFSNSPDDRNDPGKQPFQSWTMLLMENYYAGNKSVRLELGIGGVIGHLENDLVGKRKVKPPGLTFTTGLRFLPTKKNPISFKIAFTPIIARGHFYPRVGVSIGWGVNTLF